jgi:hypothetical protein
MILLKPTALEFKRQPCPEPAVTTHRAELYGRHRWHPVQCPVHCPHGGYCLLSTVWTPHRWAFNDVPGQTLSNQDVVREGDLGGREEVQLYEAPPVTVYHF